MHMGLIKTFTGIAMIMKFSMLKSNIILSIPTSQHPTMHEATTLYATPLAIPPWHAAPHAHQFTVITDRNCSLVAAAHIDYLDTSYFWQNPGHN